MLPTKFHVNWLFSSGEAKNRFSRWLPWISDRKSFSYFRCIRCFLSSFKSIGLFVQKKGSIDFQDGGHGGHLGFCIGTILAIFDLQVTPMLQTKFQVNWPFSSGKVKKKIQDGRHGGHFGSRIGKILAIFYLQVTLMLPSELQVN